MELYTRTDAIPPKPVGTTPPKIPYVSDDDVVLTQEERKAIIDFRANTPKWHIARIAKQYLAKGKNEYAMARDYDHAIFKNKGYSIRSLKSYFTPLRRTNHNNQKNVVQLTVAPLKINKL